MWEVWAARCPARSIDQHPFHQGNTPLTRAGRKGDPRTSVPAPPSRLLLTFLVAGLVVAGAGGARARAAPRIEDVEEALSHDRSYKVRVDAALVLGRLRQTRSIPALIG